MPDENSLAPLHVFRFHIDFKEDPFGSSAPGQDVPLCSGAFSDCTGLEATMEPKVIKEGGRNYGPAQRAGPVTFSTVILKRGVTKTRDLFHWFEMLTARSSYAYRLAAFINVYEPSAAVNQPPRAVLTWKLAKVMPIKFKFSDLNARGSEVGIEELHLAHEGLTLVATPTRPTL